METATLAWLVLLTGALIIGFGFGLLAAATRYCNLGAIADWVNIGDRGRFRAWILSVAVAVLGVAILEYAGGLDPDQTRAGYRMAEFPVLRYVFGGLVFGAGMVLAGGCTTRTLVHIGSGNLRAAFVYLMVGLTAAALLYLPGPRIWIEEVLPWPGWSLDQAGLATQDIGAIASLLPGELSLSMWRLVAAMLVTGLLAWLVIRLGAGQAMRRRDRIAGLSIGLLVVAAWALTGSPVGMQLMAEATAAFSPPAGTGTQSLSFVAPAAELLRLATSPQVALLTFGIAAMTGVILGSATWFMRQGQWRLQVRGSWREWLRQGIGGMLMGAGGIVAMGCSVGQGMTGVSTLALGSLLTLASMMLGSFVTLKLMFYRMAHPGAGPRTLLLALATDLKLRPARHHPLPEDRT
ncbi:MAG: YeeE/YedE family protein [Halothiobacillaceae bacterium]